MITDISANKKISSDSRRTIICQAIFFSVLKEVRLSSAHYLIMKIHNKNELQSVANNHSTNVDYKYFKKIYRKCTSEPYYVLTIDTALPAENPLCFRKNLSDSL